MRSGSGYSWGDGKRSNSFLIRMGCNHLHYFFFQSTMQDILKLVDEEKEKTHFSQKKSGSIKLGGKRTNEQMNHG